MYDAVFRCVYDAVLRCVYDGVFRCVYDAVFKCVYDAVFRCVYDAVLRCLYDAVFRCVSSDGGEGGERRGVWTSRPPPVQRTLRVSRPSLHLILYNIFILLC